MAVITNEKAYNNVIGLYLATPLHPSVEQVSQNLILPSDFSPVFRHSPIDAFQFCRKHDRVVIILF